MLSQDIIFSENPNELLTRFKYGNYYLLLIYCVEGQIEMGIENHECTLVPHDMLLCRPSAITGQYLPSPDLRCTIIAVREHALDDIVYTCVREDNKWWEKSKFLSHHPVLHLNERQQELGVLFNRLFQLYNEDTNSGLSENIRLIFAQAAVYELLNWLEESMPDSEVTQATENHRQGRKEVLFRDFIRLIQETEGQQREVQWYADQLAVSPKYLSAVSKDISGQSAHKVIDNIAAQEIKRLLRQTDMSVKEICVRMKFPSLSFFCKYVHAHFGMTARQIREKE